MIWVGCGLRVRQYLVNFDDVKALKFFQVLNKQYYNHNAVSNDCFCCYTHYDISKAKRLLKFIHINWPGEDTMLSSPSFSKKNEVKTPSTKDFFQKFQLVFIYFKE